MKHASESSEQTVFGRDPSVDGQTGQRQEGWWRGARAVGVLRRLAFLVVSAVVLYLLAPGLITVLGAWKDLGDIRPGWFVGMILVEALSLAFVSMFTKLVLPSVSLFGNTCAQLSGHALSTVIPGGAATGGTVEYKMLVKAGAEPAAVGSAMAVQGIVLTAAVFVLPVFALPAMILGAGAPPGLAQTAYLGFGMVVLLLGLGSVLMTWDRAMRAIAVTISNLGRLFHKPVDRDALTARLLTERNFVRQQLGRRWFEAVLFSVGKWLLEFAVLVLALKATGVSVRPSLVLLAYTASALLSMIPLTPGGLGFVEAGLAGTLALAGVPLASIAVVTLSYRLVTYWLPLPVGFVAWQLHRFHYRDRRGRGHSPRRSGPLNAT